MLCDKNIDIFNVKASDIYNNQCSFNCVLANNITYD
jgi:hypothetical protein